MSIIFDAVLGKLRKADAGGSSGLADAPRYLHYQLLGVSGSLGTVYYEHEIEFKISR